MTAPAGFVRLLPLVALTMVAFAANSLLNKVALAETGTGPSSFAAIRLASGTLVLSALVLAGRGAARLRVALNPANGAALAVYVLGFSFAYVTLDAGLGALILFGAVQVTMFAGGVLAGETIPPRRWAGAALAFLGLVWVLMPSGSVAVPLGGAGLMLAAGIGWGLFSLRGRQGGDPLAATAAAFALALLPALAFAMIRPDALSAAGAALAMVSGGVTSGLGYALWYRVLPALGASLAAVAQLSVPILAMAGGGLFLGETLSLRFVVATALVIGGVMIAVPRPVPPAR